MSTTKSLVTQDAELSGDRRLLLLWDIVQGPFCTCDVLQTAVDSGVPYPQLRFSRDVRNRLAHPKQRGFPAMDEVHDALSIVEEAAARISQGGNHPV